ncbi:copper amine oxidase N-terminal domain-containing protein [Paenibacillus eucommiae]|uniref:Copper amine oxidase-like N-terminal domain-containing protein n=1 Tax=Paenibacillus eucommiae TaxID=1355755 RepID=A0ABS4J2K2_9BACL|nr:copper amine oxidase N-terminal domain-containing protein [Paenibacillus eucommiae]MBP1994035.1 hypothetical protein [Paenibacillus eucommiae]
MKLRKWKLGIAGALVLLLVIVTGCEALQGYEIGQVLQNSVSTKSGESKGTVEVELVKGNTDMMNENEQHMFELLQNFKLILKSVKTQDQDHVSVNAEFSYSQGTIPFQIVYDGGKMIIHVEGAKKPIVLNGLSVPTQAGGELLSEDLQQELTKKVYELIPSAAKFIIQSAPNPKKISLEQTTAQVNNENLSLKKLHAEIYGNELEGLVKKFLTNLIADEKGLKELIGQFYDALMPTIKKSIQAAQEAELGASGMESVGEMLGGTLVPDLLNAYMDNKTLVVEFASTTIQTLLKSALKSIETELQASEESLIGSEITTLLSDQTSVKLDLYFDQDKLIRKAQVDLHIPIGEDSSPISAIKIKTDMENWNLNKPVTSDKIDLSAGAWELDDMQSVNEYAMLNNWDPNSQFYKLLKDDLKITRKDFSIYLGESNEYEEYSINPFINSKGVAMVPIELNSEEFGVDLEWNEDMDQITLKDRRTGKPITVTIDSDIATVDGAKVKLDSPAVLMESDFLFVPLRFLATSLDFNLEWESSTKTVFLNRD